MKIVGRVHHRQANQSNLSVLPALFARGYGKTLRFATSMTQQSTRATRKTGKTPQVHQSCHRPAADTLPDRIAGRFRVCAGGQSRSLERLWPASSGCNIAYNTGRNVINEPHVVWTQHAIKHELRKAAKAAWETSRFECPEHAESEAFRDGFIDGYVDYLDRGGNASLPAVPPAKYTRHKDYYTDNGQCLVKEYFLGFKHGQEVAIASGQRQLLTVPVLLPQEPTGPPTFIVTPAAGDSPPPMIPPRPLGGIEPSAGATSNVPPVVVPRDPAAFRAPVQTRAGGTTPKRSPPADYGPISKPLQISAEFPASAVIEPESPPSAGGPSPLPPRSGPSGPEVWGSLPAIPAVSTGPPVATPQLPPPVDQPASRVTPPNHSVRPPLPPNHPQPHQ